VYDYVRYYYHNKISPKTKTKTLVMTVTKILIFRIQLSEGMNGLIA